MVADLQLARGEHGRERVAGGIVFIGNAGSLLIAMLRGGRKENDTLAIEDRLRMPARLAS